MNFFGHAVVASWHSADDDFILGAMLPDFASMLSVTIEPTPGSALASGVRFHHHTDQVFHQSRTFKHLEAWARSVLNQFDIAKGPRRAVAHIGIEMLIDELFDADNNAKQRYLRAVDPELTPTEGARIRARGTSTDDIESSLALERLRHRLRSRVPQTATVSLESMLFRLTRALEQRPRLALHRAQHADLAEFFEAARNEVRNHGSALVRELEMGLNLQAPAGLGDPGLKYGFERSQPQHHRQHLPGSATSDPVR